jgi:transposase
MLSGSLSRHRPEHGVATAADRDVGDERAGPDDTQCAAVRRRDEGPRRSCTRYPRARTAPAGRPRDELGRARTQTIIRIHRLLLELLSGGAKKFLSAAQARALIAATRPRDIVGKTCRKLVAELITELEGIDRKIKACKKEIMALVAAQDSTLLQLHGIGPSGAARLLADVGNIHRFASRDHFASWNGTAPLDASSGQQQRHRLSRAGNRRINRALHIMAVVQLRHPTEGRAYYDAKPPVRPRWKPCAASSGACPTSPAGRSSKTRTGPRQRPREGTRGRHFNPA